MKLGDNMAPLEACKVWNDVCPRKTRPPKIGDIPRHVAVDEESPGSSNSRSVTTARAGGKSMLERSTGCHTERGKKPAASGDLAAIETLLKSSEPTKKAEQPAVRIARESELKQGESLDRSLHANSFPVNNTSNGPFPGINDDIISPAASIAVTSLQECFQRSPCVQVLKSIGELESKEFDDDESDFADGLFDVRKDSALYLEGSEIGESLVKTGASIIQPGTAASLHPDIDEIVTSGFSGPRTRRESSGYFSNLGTFDEDRWNSGTLDLVNQQEATNATRESFRERRRSSTKNRLPLNNQHQFAALGSSGQQMSRVATVICPTDGDTDLFLMDSDIAAIPKISRLEMPNIDEQPNLEFDKTTCRDHREPQMHQLPEIDTYLAREMSKVSIETLPLEVDSIESEKARDRLISNDNAELYELENNSDNSGNQLNVNSRTAARQRRRMVVHQYSSPNMTNTELESIVEKPHSETLVKSITHSEFADTDQDIDKPTDCGEAQNHPIFVSEVETMEASKLDETDMKKLLPRSVKVYQLLSTQSEDRGDGDARLFDRRISLQITRHNEDEVSRGNASTTLPVDCIPLCSEYVEEKKLVHADSVPILKIPSLDVSAADSECSELLMVQGGVNESRGSVRKLSSPGDLRLCGGERISGGDIPSGPSIANIRPIYPYCPYSPYASPQGSPRINRRRPLRESRRVSIDSRQGALQLNQYKLLNNIGQGSFGIVKLAYNEEDDTHYAMKILSKKKLMKKAGIFGRMAPGRKGVSSPLAKVYREIALLKKLDHPNVVKLVEVLDDPDEDNLYLVFELVQKGEVLQLPTDKPLDEETARKHFRDVVMGVEYLHYQRIVHRDIKPSNLLVDGEGRVKVADLGVSAELRAAGELLSGSAGTPAFAAPETTTPGAQYSGTLCDVWSMGVTLYSLVTGKVPWDGAGSIIGVQSAVRSEPLRFPETPRLSENLRDLISRMLTKDPTRRMTLAEIKEHCWLTNDEKEPLPSEVDNCRLPVTVTDEEVARVVTRVPKLDTLILIKTMLKQHSFQNPFLPRRIVKTGCTASSYVASGPILSSTDATETSSEQLSSSETAKKKTEKFQKSGRSNSAPDSYDWQTNGRQISSESLLAPVTESSSQETEVEKR